MALERFDLTGAGPYRHAVCEAVPPLMVISGPNGVGKSRLLHDLYTKRNAKPQVQFTGSALYLSPHRVWRKLQATTQQAWGSSHSYWDILASEGGTGIPGIQGQGQRSPETIDEAPSGLKWALASREVKRMAAVTRTYDLQKSLPEGAIADIYAPIRELTAHLLPHLDFDGVRTRPEGNVIEAIWRKKHGPASHEIELDEMSSGERAVLTMFGPFLERRIDAILANHTPAITRRPPGDVTVFIDEPELHLHPILQSHLLGYLRRQIRESAAQFVLVTHSPTIILEASYGELFVLTPETNDAARNQLVKLADDPDRLSLITELCGDRQVVTSFRRILCVEGAVESRSSKVRTDASVFAFLCPELSEFALVSCRSKDEAISTARALREGIMGQLAIPEILALVDRDQDEAPSAEKWVRRLPVAMMENLLLTPSGISRFLQPYSKRISDHLPEAVERNLRAFALLEKEEEIRLRVERHSAKGGAPSETDREAAIREVDRILTEGRELDEFRGKPILQRFYDGIQQGLGMSRSTFMTELARHCGDAPRVGPNKKPARDILISAVTAVAS